MNYSSGRILLCLATLLCLTAVLLPAAPAEEAQKPAPVYRTIEEMAGMRFAYVKGSVYDKYVESRIEGTTTMFFPSLADCIAALESNKVDGVVQRSYALELAVNRRGGTVAMLPRRCPIWRRSIFSGMVMNVWKHSTRRSQN